MWVWAAIFYYYECLLQVSPSVMTSNLMQAFSIHAEGLGYLSAIYFYAYASMQIPVGMLLDRFGPRKLLSVAAITCGLGAVIFSQSHLLFFAGLGRLLIGLGSAFAAIGCLKIAAIWFSVDRFAWLAGLTVMLGMLGATTGQAPLAYLVNNIGWRSTLLSLGVAGLFLGLALFSFIKDGEKNQRQEQQHLSKDFINNLKAVIKNRKIRVATCYCGLVFAPMPALAALWGVPFLTSSCHYSKEIAAGLVSLVYVGCAIGSPMWSALSNHMGKRRLPLMLGAVGAFITSTLIVIFPTSSTLFLSINLFLFGLFCSSFLLVFAMVREISPNKNTATALGFTNMSTMLGTAILQAVIGKILDIFWHGGLEHGVRIYSAHNYQLALIIVPLCFAISFCLLPFMCETNCQRSVDESEQNQRLKKLLQTQRVTLVSKLNFQ